MVEETDIKLLLNVIDNFVKKINCISPSIKRQSIAKLQGDILVVKKQ